MSTWDSDDTCEGCGEAEGVRCTDDHVWVCDECWDASLVPVCPFCAGEGVVNGQECVVCLGIGATEELAVALERGTTGGEG